MSLSVNSLFLKSLLRLNRGFNMTTGRWESYFCRSNLMPFWPQWSVWSGETSSEREQGEKGGREAWHRQTSRLVRKSRTYNKSSIHQEGCGISLWDPTGPFFTDTCGPSWKEAAGVKRPIFIGFALHRPLSTIPSDVGHFSYRSRIKNMFLPRFIVLFIHGLLGCPWYLVNGL